MPTWTPPVTLVAKTNENVNDLNAIITSLQAVINSLDDANLSATAGIQQSKLANGATGLAIGAFSAYRNAAISITTGSIVPFDTEEWDVSGWHDTATNVGRFTPQVAGYYRLSWMVHAGGPLAVNNWWKASLRKNGVLAKGGSVAWQVTTAALINSTGTAIVQANGTTDFFDVVVDHNQGVASAISPASATTYFQGELIGRS
jgi:hypothetical protein